MQFTPQQLVGAGRYAPATRIGNWNEDLMLEEARMKEFQLRKKQGSLLATHKLKSDFLHQLAPRSFDPRGALHLNDAVGVQHCDSDALLSCNVFEETPSIGSGEFLVTAASSSGLGSGSALARNTFRLVSPQTWKASHELGFACTERGDALCYGEPFFLMCNEALLVDDKSVLLKPPLFLKSGLKTERSMSPISYNQRVWMSAEPDSSALWVCDRADLAKTEKLLAAGRPVLAGDPVAVVHKMTGQPLLCDATHKQPTDFGVELELCAFAAKTAGKYHNIGAEALGTRTADTEARAQLPPNTWTFVLAASAREATDERQLPDVASPATVRAVIQQCLLGSSLYAFRAFVADLERAEAKQHGRTGHLNCEEAKWMLKPYQLPLRDDHIDLLFASFDKRNTGHFPLAAFLDALRTPVPSARKAEIEAAYTRLAQQTDGKLTLGALSAMYDPSIDSRVRGKQVSVEDAVAEYRSLWTTQTAPAEIPTREFVDVYSDISSAVASDAHFHQLLAESWKAD